jgi:5-methylcytosine-specific restriction endonuclease McrA
VFSPERRIDQRFCSNACRNNAHGLTRKMYRRAGETKTEGYLILRAEIAERDGWRCSLCSGPVDPSLKHTDPAYGTIDHVVPITRGGTNELSNLRLAHHRCNSAKGNRAGNEQLLAV